MTRTPPRTVRISDLVSNAAVRKMCGRAVKDDRKPISRHTLIRWRTQYGFPAPLDAKRAGVELWDAREVRSWLDENRERLRRWHEERAW